MKSIIITVAAILVHTSVLAQSPEKNTQYNWIVYSQIKKFLLASKKDPEQFQTKIKTKLISKASGMASDKKEEEMNAFYYNRNSYLMKLSNYNPRDKKINAFIYPKPDGLLQLAGMATGILTSIFYPSYIGNIYHNSGATIEAYNTYMQSTYRQHE